MTQEKILEKLGKIKAMADSAKEIGNEAEAQAFAGMLQQLLLKHKLEMTDVEYAREMQEEPVIQYTPETMYTNVFDRSKRRRVYKNYPDVELTRRRTAWVEQLAAIVADAYSCRILVTTGSSIIHFVGHKSNVMITEYLFITMMRAANKLSDKAAAQFRREWRAEHGSGNTPGDYRESWLMGFITRIAQRLQEERRKFEGPNTSMALVRVNKEALAVKNYMDEKFGKKKSAAIGGLRSWNQEGYAAGKRTADGMNISGNAVKEGRPNQQLRG